MVKIDGHTHTHYCPHGSREHVSKMIERAIQLGFTEYHITEHTPMPQSFLQILEPKEQLLGDMCLEEDEVDDYLKEMEQMRNKYKDKIQIKIGFEVDFLPTEVEWYKNFLNEYGKYCDTGILSVHFMEGVHEWRCVDFEPEDVKKNILPKYNGQEGFQLAYYQLIEEAVLADLGVYKPTRIGHFTLCNKFRTYLGVEETPQVISQIDKVLQLIQSKKYSLDYNAAGYFKDYCGISYPSSAIIQKAKALAIPFIYGSDAHGVEDIGRGYERMEGNLCL